MGHTLSSNIFDIARSNRRSSSLLGTMKLWQRHIQSRRRLARLDFRLLADAGINEAQRYAELNKPFWRQAIL